MKERLQAIYQKIEFLINTNRNLTSNLDSKSSELDGLRSQIEQTKQSIFTLQAEKENLEDQLKTSTLASENQNNQEIKKKLDQYISELDRCIEQLENV
jgi:chromosome segregation ATPase